MDAVALGLAFVAIAGTVWLVRKGLRGPAGSARQRVQTRPQEPCWTEAISSGGGLTCGRAHCVNDTLMDADSRARPVNY